MAEKPVEQFLDFNKDNIFENLLQAEDHLKRIKNDARFQSEHSVEALDHIQCVIKHITMAKGESSEAQAHTLKSHPENYENYLELQERLKKIKEGIASKETTIEELIEDVRDARGFFENFNPDYDISKCRACGAVEDALEVHKEAHKHEQKKEFTANEFCDMTDNPDYCKQLVGMIEKGPPETREEKLDLSKTIRDANITVSLLENIGRLANTVPLL